MRVAVLRMAGTKFNPDQFLAEHALAPAKVWRSGERDRNGLALTESGFNLTIADAGTPAELVAHISSWLERHKPVVLALKQSGASATLDLGITVGRADAFTCSVTLSPSVLAVLAEAGVELCVSAYPASD